MDKLSFDTIYTLPDGLGSIAFQRRSPKHMRLILQLPKGLTYEQQVERVSPSLLTSQRALTKRHIVHKEHLFCREQNDDDAYE